MKIHTGASAHQLYRAAELAGVTFARFDRAASRKRSHAFDVVLSGSSNYRSGSREGGQAATWDEWGIFLAAVFRADPDATMPGAYEDESHFHWATDHRFKRLTRAEQHRRHQWQAVPGGTFHVSTCECGARRRGRSNGHQYIGG